MVIKNRRERRRTFLVIPLDLNPIYTLPTEDQALQLASVPVIIDDDLLIPCKQTSEVVIGECMRVRSFGAEDHEIRDVHDSDAELWNFTTEESCCSYYFEGEFDAYAD